MTRAHLRRATAAAVALTALLLSACAGDTTASPDPTATPSPTPSASDGPSGESVDWSSPDAEQDLGDGWHAARCEGDAPQICIERDGTGVGTVEYLAFPIADPPATDDSSAMVAWLRERADDFATFLTTDRAAGCGEDYLVSFDEHASIQTDQGTWLRYAFTGTDADGTVVERGVAFLAVHGHVQTVLAANAYAPDACVDSEGSAWTVDDLDEAVVTLDRLVAGTSPMTLATSTGMVYGRVTATDAGTITVDTVEFLSGEEALRAARADGVIAADEDLPNDVYVRDRAQDALVLTVGPEATLSLVDCEAGCESVESDLAAWLADPVAPYGGPQAVYGLTIGAGELVHVAEQYLP